MPKGKGLTINQRNLYSYFLARKGRPCLVPRMPLQSSRLPDYIRALAALEERSLIQVERKGSDYRNWTVTLLSHSP